MVLFDEYSTKKLDKIIKQLNKYFYHIDKSFFRDFERLREEVKEEYSELLEDPIVHIDGDLDRFIPFEESIEIAAEVFESVNPMYKEMFLTLIKDPKYKIHYKEEFQTSINTDLALNGNAEDVLIIVHEFAHNFVMTEDDSFFLNFFAEVNSMFWEKLAADYLASEYNTNIELDKQRTIAFIKGRTMSLKRFYLDMIDKSKKGIEREGFLGVYRDANFIAKFFLDNEMLFSIPGVQIFFFSEYYHDIGFLLANAMYQDYLDNPDNIKKLYDVERINASSDVLIPECFSLLYEDDIPIIHEGKISLKGDNYNRIHTALQETMKRERVKTIVE